MEPSPRGVGVEIGGGVRDVTRKTVLHDRHVALGARMMDFGGWAMPLQYEGILAEHAAVRSGAGMFDTSHMDAFRIEGPDSLDVLSGLVTQDLRSLAVGACRYGFLLDEDAGVLDDLILYRMGEAEWMPVVNAGTAEDDFAWISRRLAGTRTVATDLREVQGKLDVQGPQALAHMSRLWDLDAGSLARFRWMRIRAAGADWVVSRTGYTGEDGVEIYATPAAIGSAWDALLDAGVKPCGLGARDTLRLEAGLPLYGHELSRAVSPAEAGLMRHCRKSEPFIGRQALLRRAEALQQRLAPFVMGGRQTARAGQPVRTAAGEEAGRVTSGAFAPTLGRAVGFALVRPDLATPGTSWHVDNGRSLLPATATKLPFLRRESRA